MKKITDAFHAFYSLEGDAGGRLADPNGTTYVDTQFLSHHEANILLSACVYNGVAQIMVDEGHYFNMLDALESEEIVVLLHLFTQLSRGLWATQPELKGNLELAVREAYTFVMGVGPDASQVRELFRRVAAALKTFEGNSCFRITPNNRIDFTQLKPAVDDLVDDELRKWFADYPELKRRYRLFTDD